MGTLIAGYLAGMLSTLSPCVLPLIPVLLASALQAHRLGPLALAAGLAVSFAGLGLLLASAGFALGLDGGTVRTGAGWLMGLFGLVLLVPALSRGFAALVQPLAGSGGGLLARVSGDGIGGQFALGLLMGAVWSPCTGPTLGAAVGLAASGDDLGRAALVMLAFALGAVTPVLALAYGLGRRRKELGAFAQRAKPAMGAVLVAVALLVLTGADKQVETALVAIMPDWLVTLTVMF
ncbi:putative cytochrome c-type biogenesis protein membrane protein [Magnetospirillum sp. LM-5]|uniref:cytochrome c biogenesis CcdA family protein n=1 Tax=Magnetospirillum sp. LM-5 TaxID=2681466 RepID=UPI0013808043|nr:cytochrome c biogenesis CcdA family protein [Magnetospirillum sp. LM-5]CAA7615335.1 putative cytochrome c-type biogenesis protein membrane protein [Magnetospirillum sp. LM-5]